MDNSEEKGFAVVFFTTYLIFTSAQQCPEPCRCMTSKEGLQVYCSNTGRKTIPIGIPQEAVSIDLSKNEIQDIHVGDLDGLDRLAFLNLSQNGLWGEAIEQGSLELPNLRSVDLSGNLYTRIPPSLPSNLQSLYFWSNPIESIDIGSFNSYKLLVELDLSNTKIKKIAPHTFDYLPSLSKVAFSYSPITNSGIPDYLFVNNSVLTSLSFRSTYLTSPLRNLPKSLQVLDYVGNDIKIIPAYAFKNLNNLQVLQLTENPIETIKDNAFEGLDNLMILDIMECNFSSVITNKTFSGLKGLQSLYFSNNRIPKIEIDALRDFHNLESLWLSGNKIRVMDKGVLDPKNVPQMVRLAIDSNPWYCDCHLKWLRERANNASYTILYLNSIKCDGHANVSEKSWDVLKPEDFVC